MGEVLVDGRGPSFSRDLARVMGGSPGPFQARDPQPGLLAGTARHHPFDWHTGFWSRESKGKAGFRRVESSPRRSDGHRGRGYFPGDAVLDDKAREFTDCLRSRRQPRHLAGRLCLVASGLRAREYLFRFRLPTLCRKSQR